MEDKNKGKIQKHDHAGAIELPFTEDQFKDFLVGLLGKPQSISKVLPGNFCITTNEIINLFQILNQRIYQQNNGKLIQFRTTIYYSDNSTTTLTGIDHLINYNESHPLISEAVHLTWQYVIKFADKERYEKQEINVSIITPSDRPRKIDMEDEMPFYYHHSSGVINIKINHTARTWGADIEGILSKHLETLITKESKVREFLRIRFDDYSRVLFIIFITITLGFVGFNFDRISSSEKSVILTICLFSGSLVLSQLAASLLQQVSFYRVASYLLMTPTSYKHKEDKEKQAKRKYIIYILSFLGSIGAGVLSNYLFFRLFGSV